MATVSGEVSIPQLTTTIYEWLTGSKIIEIKKASDPVGVYSQIIYFKKADLAPLYSMQEEYSDKFAIKAIVSVTFRKNILGLNVGNKIEILKPGFVPHPK